MEPNAALTMSDFATHHLRILLVEDAEIDAMAFRRALEKSKIQCEITHCYRAEEALEKIHDDRGDSFRYDVLVADHLLPGMYGLDFCIQVLQEEHPCALTLLTGSGSTEVATRAIEAGIDEYIVKDSQSGYLDLLPVVLPRAVKRSEDRQALRRCEESLRRCDERFLRLAESIDEVFWITSPDWKEFFFVGPAFRQIWGRSCDELFASADVWFDSILEEDRERVSEELRAPWSGVRDRPRYSTFRILRADGEIRRIECRMFALTGQDGKIDSLAGTAADVTYRERVEAVC